MPRDLNVDQGIGSPQIDREIFGENSRETLQHKEKSLKGQLRRRAPSGRLTSGIGGVKATATGRTAL